MKKKKAYILVIGLILVVLIVLKVSYALLQKNIVGDSNKVIYQVGDLEVKLDESGSKDISLTNAIPAEDTAGMKNAPYSFSLVNNAVTDLKYTIYLEDDIDSKNKCGTACELIPYNFIRYNLSNDSNSLKTASLLTSSTELYTGTIESKSTDKFNLRVWLSIDAGNSAMGKYYFGKLKVVLSQGDDYCIRNGFTKLSDCMLVINNHETSVETTKQNIVSKGTPDFSKTATTDEELFMAEDDDGPSYYYRGAVKNNYVSFAGYIWRIIRQNGDGSIRMIYAGKKTNDTGESTTIGNSAFNDKYWDPTYVGYKYNESFSLHENNETISNYWFVNTQKYDFGTDYSFDESTKKFKLTGTVQQFIWKNDHDEIVSNNLYSCLNTSCNVVYKIVGYRSDREMLVKSISYSSDSYVATLTNTTDSLIKTKLDTWYKTNLLNYASYLADETFCNDRSINWGSGYLMSSTTTYGVYGRLVEKRKPILKCLQSSDMFAMKNDVAKLNYPIALITADEVSMAGGGYNIANSNYYLYNGQDNWTLSSSVFSSDYSLAFVFYTTSSGSMYSGYYVASLFGISPVINLRSDVQITKGDGTSISPYQIKL